MNFLVLISAISSLLSTTIIPTSSKSIDHNSIYCYQYLSDWLSPKNIRHAMAELGTNMFKIRCNKAQYCGSIIISRPNIYIESETYGRVPREIMVKLTCINNDKCLFTQNSLYHDHADYDIPHKTQTVECCQGNLCNILDNLPITNECLNSPARNMEAHNVHCPNYSTNYKVIWCHQKRNLDFIIESGSNLLLLSNQFNTEYFIRDYQKYNGTSWLVTRTSDSDKNDVAIIEFNKNGGMHYNKRSQDYIAKNKIFFVTADVMHICNFTKAEGSLTIKHVDKFIGEADKVRIVKIIVNSSATSPTTIPATTNEQTDYSTTAKNTKFYTMSKSIASTINNTYSSNQKINLFKDSESADNSWKLPVIIIVPTLTAVTIIAIASYKKYGTYFHNNKNDEKNNLLENLYGNVNL